MMAFIAALTEVGDPGGVVMVNCLALEALNVAPWHDEVPLHVTSQMDPICMYIYIYIYISFCT